MSTPDQEMSPAASSSGSSGNATSDTTDESTWVLTPPRPEDDEITPFSSPQLGALSLNTEEDPIDEFKLVSVDEKLEALKIKGDANAAFAAKDFRQAIHLYSEAIALNPHDAIFWSNRAMAKMKCEEFGGAISDATKALDLDPKNVKALYRRGLSQLAILQPRPAIIDLKALLVLDPKNAEARKQLDATVKLVRRMEFEKAISVGDAESSSARCKRLIQDGACTVDASYEGPRPTPPTDGEGGRWTPTPEFVEGMIKWFRDGKQIPRRLAWEIVLGCSEALRQEKSLVEVEIPEGTTVDVVGDTHGQFYDLLHLFTLTGPPSPNHILLFNGDFVDRGSWSVEIALTLFAYKWLYPTRIYLNRGNHETQDMNKVYGFEGEVKHKLGEVTYKLFSEVFTSLPLATLLSPALAPTTPHSLSLKSPPTPAILNTTGRKRFFVVHGGLPSTDGVKLEEIAKIDRFDRQPGQQGLMMELLWTDPQDMNGRGPSKRGVGSGFGPDVTRRWCELNGITAVFRSHEVRPEGYAIEHDGLCITVFSAPNYCDSTGNLGGFIRVDASGECNFTSFVHVPHPPVKPMAYSSGFSGF